MRELATEFGTVLSAEFSPLSSHSLHITVEFPREFSTGTSLDVIAMVLDVSIGDSSLACVGCSSIVSMCADPYVMTLSSSSSSSCPLRAVFATKKAGLGLWLRLGLGLDELKPLTL
jgi:hypothetical protein